MADSIGEYRKRTGLVPIGPHRPLADALFEGWFEPCATCHGRGVLDVDRGRTWRECPDCKLAGCFFKGTPEEFQAIRSRVLSKFPKADATASPQPRAPEAAKESPTASTKATREPGPKQGNRQETPDVADGHLRLEDAVRCVFYTLAVRNEALAKKWPGGVRGYWETYPNNHNDRLTACCFMGPYWDEQREALLKSGLKEGKDFTIFDASNVILEKDYEPFHFRIAWLDGFVHQAGVMIYLRN